MNITREEVLDKINNNDCRYFYGLYNGECPAEWTKDWKFEFKTVYNQNYGDGNEYIMCFYFTELDLYVLLQGMYSSWDSPQWDGVSLAEPFQYTETRYKAVTLEYIRDKKIETVLKPDENV